MAEIKSTLDLILEKTKHMTLSDDERRELLLKEAHGKIKRWTQKFRDRGMTMDELSVELDRARKDYPSVDMATLFKKELVQSIDPEGDNGPAIDLLEQLLGEDTSRLSLLVDTFHRQTDQDKKRITETLERQLADRGISGSAVVPNHVKNEGWKAAYAERLSAFASQKALIADD